MTEGRIRRALCLLLLTSLAACSGGSMSGAEGQPAGKKAVTVGMPWMEAASLLRHAGARETQIDAVATSPSDERGSAVYELRNGSLLIVDHIRSSPGAEPKVEGLRLCRNPDVPKAMRNWEAVQEVAL